MQHWQKDRMKLVITLILAILALGARAWGVIILIILIAYWGYRWSKGNIDFKNPNKNNP